MTSVTLLPNPPDEVSDDVEVQPCLKTLQDEIFPNRSTTTDNDDRLDIKANGLFHSRISRAFFDVKSLSVC